MSNPFLKITGEFASGIGNLDGYSDEHKKFLSSGFVCPGCGIILMNWWGVADVRCYTASGKEVPLMIARLAGGETLRNVPNANIDGKFVNFLLHIQHKNNFTRCQYFYCEVAY